MRLFFNTKQIYIFETNQILYYFIFSLSVCDFLGTGVEKIVFLFKKKEKKSLSERRKLFLKCTLKNESCTAAL